MTTDFQGVLLLELLGLQPVLELHGKVQSVTKNSIVFLLANIEKKIHTADKAAGSLSRFKGRWQKIKIL